MPYTRVVVLSALAFVVTLGGSTLDANIASVVPQPTEDKWLTIPWRTNITLARREAQQSGKPLFLWIMNGSPLACT
jgi:hypothetical protein